MVLWSYKFDGHPRFSVSTVASIMSWRRCVCTSRTPRGCRFVRGHVVGADSVRVPQSNGAELGWINGLYELLIAERVARPGGQCVSADADTTIEPPSPKTNADYSLRCPLLRSVRCGARNGQKPLSWALLHGEGADGVMVL